MTLPRATPEDVAEQQAAVVEEPPEPDTGVPDEASEADVADQRREVGLDDEDTPIG